MKQHEGIINEDLEFRLLKFCVEKNNFLLELYELVFPFSLQMVDSALTK